MKHRARMCAIMTPLCACTTFFDTERAGTVAGDATPASGSDSGAAAIDPRFRVTTIREYCNVTGELVCDVGYRCLSQDDIRNAESWLAFGSEEECRLALADDCQNALTPLGDTIELREDDAAICLQAISRMTCADVEAFAAGTGDVPTECYEALDGTIPRLGTCESWLQCVDPYAACVRNPADFFEFVCTGALGAAAFTAACDGAEDWASCPGLECVASPRGGGACSAPCDSDIACGRGAICVEGGGRRLCAASCGSLADCAPFGLECIGTGTDRGHCWR